MYRHVITITKEVGQYFAYDFELSCPGLSAFKDSIKSFEEVNPIYLKWGTSSQVLYRDLGDSFSWYINSTSATFDYDNNKVYYRINWGSGNIQNCVELKIEVVVPPIWCTTDNAAMIAKLGERLYERKLFAPLSISCDPNWKIDKFDQF